MLHVIILQPSPGPHQADLWHPAPIFYPEQNRFRAGQMAKGRSSCLNSVPSGSWPFASPSHISCVLMSWKTLPTFTREVRGRLGVPGEHIPGGLQPNPSPTLSQVRDELVWPSLDHSQQWRPLHLWRPAFLLFQCCSGNIFHDFSDLRV